MQFSACRVMDTGYLCTGELLVSRCGIDCSSNSQIIRIIEIISFQSSDWIIRDRVSENSENSNRSISVTSHRCWNLFQFFCDIMYRFISMNILLLFFLSWYISFTNISKSIIRRIEIKIKIQRRQFMIALITHFRSTNGLHVIASSGL